MNRRAKEQCNLDQPLSQIDEMVESSGVSQLVRQNRLQSLVVDEIRPLLRQQNHGPDQAAETWFT